MPMSDNYVQGRSTSMTRQAPYCLWCERYEGVGYQKCKAFPNGIPDAIWDADYDHRKPYPGDTGLTFVLKKNPPVPIDWPSFGLPED